MLDRGVIRGNPGTILVFLFPRAAALPRPCVRIVRRQNLHDLFPQGGSIFRGGHPDDGPVDAEILAFRRF